MGTNENVKDDKMRLERWAEETGKKLPRIEINTKKKCLVW